MPITDNITDLATPARDTPNARALLANSTLLLFGLYYVSQLVLLWRDRDPITPLRLFGRVMLAYLLIASMWFHAWYGVWLIALIALLEDTPQRRVALVFSYLVTWQAFLYNYMTIETQAGERLPWRDLLPVLIFMGYASAYLIVYQVQDWWRQHHADPQAMQEAQRLAEARCSASISVSELSDELAIPYDVLVQYEQGTRPLRLDHARALAQRLGMPLDDLLGTKA